MTHKPCPDPVQYNALVTGAEDGVAEAVRPDDGGQGVGALSKPTSRLPPFIATEKMIMSGTIPFEVRFVPVFTGSAVWDDDPYVDQIIHTFMPHDRKHGPMLGVLHMAAARPTPGILRDLVVTVGEDAKAGRYGNFSLFICSEDEDTRSVIGDVAASRNVAMFVCSSSADLKDAEPVGALTAKDRETLRLVSQAGGTVTALSLAEQVNIEKTAAGNRLVSLQLGQSDTPAAGPPPALASGLARRRQSWRPPAGPEPPALGTESGRTTVMGLGGGRRVRPCRPALRARPVGPRSRTGEGGGGDHGGEGGCTRSSRPTGGGSGQRTRRPTARSRPSSPRSSRRKCGATLRPATIRR